MLTVRYLIEHSEMTLCKYGEGTEAYIFQISASIESQRLTMQYLLHKNMPISSNIEKSETPCGVLEDFPMLQLFHAFFFF